MSVLETYNVKTQLLTRETSLDDGSLEQVQSPTQYRSSTRLHGVVPRETLTTNVVNVDLSDRIQEKKCSLFSRRDVHHHFYSEIDKADAIAKANSYRLKDIVRGNNSFMTEVHSQTSNVEECKRTSLNDNIEDVKESTGGNLSMQHRDEMNERCPTSDFVYNDTFHRCSKNSPTESDNPADGLGIEVVALSKTWTTPRRMGAF